MSEAKFDLPLSLVGGIKLDWLLRMTRHKAEKSLKLVITFRETEKERNPIKNLLLIYYGSDFAHS